MIGVRAVAERRTMKKHPFLALAAVGVLALAAVPSASATSKACPASFETLTIQQAVDIKIELGYPLTREELEAALRSVDQNGDGIVCAGDLPDTWFPPYIANMLDNRVSVP
jgi:hypothetical protein